jgi:hypothetical protein
MPYQVILFQQASLASVERCFCLMGLALNANEANDITVRAPKPRYLFPRRGVATRKLGAPLPSMFPEHARAARANVFRELVARDVLFQRSECTPVILSTLPLCSLPCPCRRLPNYFPPPSLLPVLVKITLPTRSVLTPLPNPNPIRMHQVTVRRPPSNPCQKLQRPLTVRQPTSKKHRKLSTRFPQQPRPLTRSSHSR